MQDRARVADARAGNRDAFDHLVRQHADLAFRYALSLLGDYGLAEDATQEAFVSAYFGLDSLRDDVAFAGWLRGIVRNQCLRVLRGRRATLVPLESAIELASPGVTPGEGAERNERRRRVLGAIGGLPEGQRTVVTLYYGGDYSQREISEFLDLPVTTINNRLHAARRTLRGGLIEMMYDELGERGPSEGFAGRVGQIIESRGPVARAAFETGRSPRPLDTLTAEEGMMYAVVQRLEGDTVRCVPLQLGADLRPGIDVTDSGRLADRPISPAILRDAVGFLIGRAVEPAGIIETGIKAIDLLCPLPDAGAVGMYGPQGAGKLVILGEILHRLGSAESRLSLLNFVQADTVDAIPVDEPLPNGAGPVESFYLPVADASDPTSSSVQEVRDALVSAVYCSREMAAQMLYPAVDPLISWSRMLTPGFADGEHVRLAAEARALLSGDQGAEHPSAAQRARKLRLFLTQPFFTTEAYTKLPGEYVTPEQTLEGCRQILSGNCDELPEEAFRFTGSLDQVRAKAASST